MTEERPEDLGQRYGTERRARHDRFADVPACVDALSDSYTLGLITNGACLQREKLATAGLDEYFDVVVVSAECDRRVSAKAAGARYAQHLHVLSTDWSSLLWMNVECIDDEKRPSNGRAEPRPARGALRNALRRRRTRCTRISARRRWMTSLKGGMASAMVTTARDAAARWTHSHRLTAVRAC
jgi:hypothetical protein